MGRGWRRHVTVCVPSIRKGAKGVGVMRDPSLGGGSDLPVGCPRVTPVLSLRPLSRPVASSYPGDDGNGRAGGVGPPKSP